MRRIRAIITGRVQGVSYRASASHVARTLRITGWVKNRSDGGVELEAEGPEEQIAALLEWCEQGPPGAKVINVAVTELPVSGSESQFEIAY